MRRPILAAPILAVLTVLALVPATGPAMALQAEDCLSQIRSVRQALDAGQAVRDGGKGPSSQTAEAPQALGPDQRADVLRLVDEAEAHARSGDEGRCTTAVQSADAVLSSTMNVGPSAEGSSVPPGAAPR